jgi:hypothetical protein
MSLPVAGINNANFGKVISKGTNSSTNNTPRMLQVQAASSSNELLTSRRANYYPLSTMTKRVL